MRNERDNKQHKYPAEILCKDDGKPRHDNPHHAGAHSHIRRSQERDDELIPYKIHARAQCGYSKSMKRL